MKQQYCSWRAAGTRRQLAGALPRTAQAAQNPVAPLRGLGRPLAHHASSTHLAHRRGPRSCTASSARVTAAPTALQWASAVSTRPDLDKAINDAIAAASKGLAAGQPPELAFVFLSSAYNEQVDDTVALLRAKLPSLKHVFGCSVSVIAAECLELCIYNF